jgi:hypothetical protein
MKHPETGARRRAGSAYERMSPRKAVTMRAVYLRRSGAKAASPRIGDVVSCDARRWAVIRVLIPVLSVGAVMVGLG